jgi:hypothetical protein
MSAAAIGIRRRDPAVIAARAHHVLDAAARAYERWPDENQEVIGRAFISLHVALEKFALADGEQDREQAAEVAATAMAILLLAVSVFLGKDAADQMMRDAAEVAR